MSPRDKDSKRLTATTHKARHRGETLSQSGSTSSKTTTNCRRSAQRDKGRKSSGAEGGSGGGGGSDMENCSNLNEMATTDASFLLANDSGCNEVVVQETNLMDGDKRLLEEEEDITTTPALATASSSSSASPSKNNDLNKEPLPTGWEQHLDKVGLYYWHVATGVIQRTRPVSCSPPRRASLVFYHDDEEINQATQKTNSDDDDDEYYDGAALTVDDTSESTFVVYPLGCCEFDETQLVAATSSKAIQKCILRLFNKPSNEESLCWGLNQTQPVLMKLFDDHIQFTDISTQTLLRSQPIQTIKSWAVDDDNNFAFVIEDRPCQQHYGGGQSNSTDYFGSVEEALLNEPSFMCYVFRSLDDDDMSCKVAAKLNEEITRYKEHMMNRLTKSTRVQQMIEQPAGQNNHLSENNDDDDEDDFDDELEVSNEVTLNVKYIGSTPVPRPTGIDILNVAIDKCLAETNKAQVSNSLAQSNLNELEETNFSPLIDAKLHISPSSVIVENVVTGEIIVECRIRYLTFMGISKRDIRWCGFIMQNSINKTFKAHCFECHPTAGHVCEAIQLSCSRMYEKVMKNARQPDTMSIIPTSSKIRSTLAKTFSRIKLNPIK